ncbi:MAG: twin-arginine translocase TatA/TatE family subunit [Acidimicrobiales bacterium]|jgi:sec-independent protein translocase protein TatB
MLSLSPAKLLVILVIALIVLGPEKLPQVARQIGAAWHDLRQWRSRIESEVRGAFPDLPPTHEVATIVRSPLAFLDRLADEHEKALSEEPTASAEATDPSPGIGPGPPGEGAGTAAGEPEPGPPAASNGSVGHNGSVATNGSVGHNGSGGGVSSPVGPAEAPVERSGAFPAVPDDPSMN